MKCLFLLLCLAAAVVAKELPAGFYGTWDLDHSENFDEYLAAKGYSWLTRKLVTLSHFKKIFARAAGGHFDYSNLTTKKDVHYKDVKLGKEFVGEGLDGGKHKVKFFMTGSVVHERHIPLGEGTAKPETYDYELVQAGGQQLLRLTMEAGGVVGKRFYKRIA